MDATNGGNVEEQSTTTSSDQLTFKIRYRGPAGQMFTQLADRLDRDEDNHHLVHARWNGKWHCVDAKSIDCVLMTRRRE